MELEENSEHKIGKTYKLWQKRAKYKLKTKT